VVKSKTSTGKPDATPVNVKDVKKTGMTKNKDNKEEEKEI
jgi:hypothetical protein